VSPLLADPAVVTLVVGGGRGHAGQVRDVALAVSDLLAGRGGTVTNRPKCG